MEISCGTPLTAKLAEPTGSYHFWSILFGSDCNAYLHLDSNGIRCVMPVSCSVFAFPGLKFRVRI